MISFLGVFLGQCFCDKQWTVNETLSEAESEKFLWQLWTFWSESTISNANDTTMDRLIVTPKWWVELTGFTQFRPIWLMVMYHLILGGTVDIGSAFCLRYALHGSVDDGSTYESAKFSNYECIQFDTNTFKHICNAATRWRIGTSKYLFLDKTAFRCIHNYANFKDNEYRVANYKRRLVAELIDGVLGFVIKLIITYILMETGFM